jgi:hypothetical protein
VGNRIKFLHLYRAGREMKVCKCENNNLRNSCRKKSGYF